MSQSKELPFWLTSEKKNYSLDKLKSLQFPPVKAEIKTTFLPLLSSTVIIPSSSFFDLSFLPSKTTIEELRVVLSTKPSETVVWLEGLGSFSQISLSHLLCLHAFNEELSLILKSLSWFSTVGKVMPNISSTIIDKLNSSPFDYVSDVEKSVRWFDLCRFCNENWVSSVLIEDLLNRFKECWGIGKFVFLDDGFTSLILNSCFKNIFNIDISCVEKIFLFYNIRETHWGLFLVDLIEKKVSFGDSLNWKDSALQHLPSILLFLNNAFNIDTLNWSKELHCIPNYPFQPPSSGSCGIVALSMIENIVRNDFDIYWSHDRAINFRLKYCAMIVDPTNKSYHDHVKNTLFHFVQQFIYL